MRAHETLLRTTHGFGRRPMLQQCYVGFSVFLRGDSTDIKLQASGNIKQKKVFKSLTPLFSPRECQRT